jgi:small subunit ribosomal protein S1
MDAVQTMTSVETPVEELVREEDAQETGEPIQDQVDTSEMRELPVEDWDYQRPRRGEVRTGVVLAIHEQEIIVDVGAKRDGIVPYADMQRMGDEALGALSVGDEVQVYVLRPEDQDGNLLVSLYLARQAQAWTRAQELSESGEVWEGEVVGYNKGGVVVPVGEIRGFVPASQVPGFPLGLKHDERLTRLSTLVGETLMVKVIEINRRKRRLILSATAAQQEWRKKQRKKLLEDLREGEVRTGVVSSLCNFGAFVDLGGADGLVHLSELSWRRIRHPREVVNVGDEVEVYVLRLDHDRKRIGLSLKRLQPEPWALVEDKYELGQLVEGVVTNVVDFGAFAEIEEGIEGLIHVSELSDAQISHPRDVVKKGDLLLLRIIRIDARRKRLGLSLKRVLESEWAEWAARLAVGSAEQEAKAEAAESTSREEADEVTEAPAMEDVEQQELAEPTSPSVAEEVEEPSAEILEAQSEEPELAESSVEEAGKPALAAEGRVEEQELAEPTSPSMEEEVEEPSAEILEAQSEEPELAESIVEEAGKPALAPEGGVEEQELAEPTSPSMEEAAAEASLAGEPEGIGVGEPSDSPGAGVQIEEESDAPEETGASSVEDPKPATMES